MRDLVIQPAKEGKGRSFGATLVSYVTADNLWAGGQATTETTRPVWAMFAGSDNELRPFMANIQLGRKAEVSGSHRKTSDKFEVLKSAGFQSAWQRSDQGSVAVLFSPALFRLDPGMVDPKGIEFCILPAKSWLSDTAVDPKVHAYLRGLGLGVPEELETWILQLAPLFIAYLDRRTRCPLVPDPRFYAQVLAAALSHGLASRSLEDGKYYSSYNLPWGCHQRMGYTEYNTGEAGYAPGVAFWSTHDELERFLAEQVRIYFDSVK